jgi:hypothetical protein
MSNNIQARSKVGVDSMVLPSRTFALDKPELSIDSIKIDGDTS